MPGSSVTHHDGCAAPRQEECFRKKGHRHSPGSHLSCRGANRSASTAIRQWPFSCPLPRRRPTHNGGKRAGLTKRPDMKMIRRSGVALRTCSHPTERPDGEERRLLRPTSAHLWRPHWQLWTLRRPARTLCASRHCGMRWASLRPFSTRHESQSERERGPWKRGPRSSSQGKTTLGATPPTEHSIRKRPSDYIRSRRPIARRLERLERLRIRCRRKSGDRTATFRNIRVRCNHSGCMR